MAEVSRKGEKRFLSFGEKETDGTGLRAGPEYELCRACDGVWVLVERPATHEKAAQTAYVERAAAQSTDSIEQKITGMLRKLPPQERMEGRFEKKLLAAERVKFAEMLAAGKVVKYKSSEVFRKALYTIPKNAMATRPEKKFDNAEKPIEEFSLEKDGFLVVRNETRAKALSEELRERIKAGEIRGTRAFSGEFFIIQSALLESTSQKLLNEMKQLRNATLGQLAEKTGLTPTLIRIAAEFTKEDGAMIEKKKESYQYIS
ncbi:MAG: hypothetical protein HY544_00175 [Candidatus Diapherotrites archaeon]|uniref:Uncharacterized protein n=1 Tax=Candidatus Iainarchaeum sp. TaxID=3101447 RepID=A0A8T3YI26_9ARCH|nr:hypothetical protein [Candidatus Diapherotrites archaeon]